MTDTNHTDSVEARFNAKFNTHPYDKAQHIEYKAKEIIRFIKSEIKKSNSQQVEEADEDLIKPNAEYLDEIEIVWERTVAPNKVDVFRAIRHALIDKDKVHKQQIETNEPTRTEQSIADIIMEGKINGTSANEITRQVLGVTSQQVEELTTEITDLKATCFTMDDVQQQVEEAVRKERERIISLAGGEPYIYVPNITEANSDTK